MAQTAILLILTTVTVTMIAHDQSTKWQPRSCPKQCSCYNAFHLQFQEDLNIVNCESSAHNKFPVTKMPLDVQAILLKGNNIGSIDIFDAELQLPNLLYLDISTNLITSIGNHTVLNRAYYLRVLNLTDNSLVYLGDESFSGLSNLQELHLRGNNLITMGKDVFWRLNQLRKLDISLNRFSYVYNEWWSNTPNLHELSLAQNDLTFLQDAALNGLQSLHSLDLSGNHLIDMWNKSLVDLSKLEVLLLSDNHFTAIPTNAISVVKYLRYLRLDNNQIDKVNKKTFDGMLKLSEISLNRMAKLSIIDRDAFNSLPKLRILSIHDNPSLAYIDADFVSKCPQLTHLYLHNNNLSAIQQTWAKNFPMLQMLSVYANPFICDCTANWLINWKHSQVMFEAKRLACYKPQEGRFELISNLSMTTNDKCCPPRITAIIGHEHEKSIGDTFSLDCRAVGLPKPELFWILPSGEAVMPIKQIKQQSVSIDDCGTLTVTNVKKTDAGMYTCVARNHDGDARFQAYVKVNINVVLIATSINATSATIFWNIPTDIEIFLQRLDSADEAKISRSYAHAASVKQPTRNFTLSKLEPQTNYKVCSTVRTENGVEHIACIRFQTKAVSSNERRTQSNYRLNSYRQSDETRTIIAVLISVCLVGITIYLMM